MNNSLYQDEHWMRVALSYAARVAGQTMPNPAVGCAIVKDAALLAAAHTALSGRPHAEAQALQIAGDAAQGATVYVTLEPCAHIGKTGACARALIEAGVARVVVAVGDPDPRVNGQGVQMLRDAGMAVDVGVCASEAAHQHRGFFKRMRSCLPWVSVKLATSLDGCIANAQGESQWITSEAARAHGHLLRAMHDVILTGSGTVAADNPSLTCRLDGMIAASPVRVVMDSSLLIKEDSALVMSAHNIPVWIITGAEYDREKLARLKDLGVQVHHLATEKPQCEEALQWLAAQGVTSVLVEAGAVLSTAMLASGCVDEVFWYRAPMVLGVGAQPALLCDGGRALVDMARWQHISTRQMGLDMLEHYDVRKV